jgi:hypothetical protein
LNRQLIVRDLYAEKNNAAGLPLTLQDAGNLLAQLHQRIIGATKCSSEEQSRVEVPHQEPVQLTPSW